MALSDRNIVITPNRGSASQPQIRFVGADVSNSATMLLSVSNTGSVATLAFTGASGQLLSITDSLTLGTSTTTGALQVIGSMGIGGNINVGGSLGIGVNPSFKLDVKGGSGNGIPAQRWEVDGGSSIYVELERDSGGGGTAVFGTAGNHNLSFKTNDSIVYTMGPSAVSVTQNSSGFGIGTSSPSGRLSVTTGSCYFHVAGDLYGSAAFGPRLANDGYCSVQYNWGTYGAGNLWVYDFSTGSMDLQRLSGGTSGGSLFNISSAGNVGMGTTPSWKLHLISKSDANVGLGIESTGTTRYSLIRLITNGNDWEIGAGGSGTTDANNFYIYDLGGSAYRVYINSSGNVGIGTTTVNNKLEVSGTLYQRDAYASLGGYNSGGQNTPFNGYGATFGTNITSGQAETDIWNPTDPATYTTTGILFTQALSATTRRDLMFLRHDGNVGIATNSPRQKLDVVGKVIIEGGSANWDETTPGTTTGTIHIDPGSSTDNFGGAITFGASDSGNGETAHAGIYIRSDSTYGTKMYFATTDAYASGSKTRMFIGHDGNVGIGTTSPTGQSSDNRVLEIYGAGTGNRAQIHLCNSNTGEGATDGTFITVESGGSLYVTNYETGSIIFETGGLNTRFKIDNGGNITKGSNNYVMPFCHISTSSPTAIQSGDLWWESDTGRMKIWYNDGSSSQWVDVVPVIDTSLYYSKSGGAISGSVSINGTLDVTGNITATGEITAYYSDRRLKTDVKILEDALEKVKKLNGVSYRPNELAKNLGLDSNSDIVGLFADEVEEVLPQAVKSAPFDLDSNGQSKSGENYKTVQYEKVVPLLVEAIKEQQKIIEDQQTKIDQLMKHLGL